MNNLGGRVSPMYRYRALTPEQEVEVRKARAAGASCRDLAVAYDVGLRTIYRAIHRAARDHHRVVLAGYSAMFELEPEDGPPIQVTPWVPA